LIEKFGDTIKTLPQWRAATGQDMHSLIATPDQLFVNAGANDYHLSASSPATDKGTSQNAPTSDLEGNSRPGGAAWDIGAYERAGAPPANRRHGLVFQHRRRHADGPPIQRAGELTKAGIRFLFSLLATDRAPVATVVGHGQVATGKW
jgi:hypothetical protein